MGGRSCDGGLSCAAEVVKCHRRRSCSMGPVLQAKVKVMSICPAPIHETYVRRSGIVKRYHSFTCTPCVSSAVGLRYTCLCLLSRSWYSFTNPGGMEGYRPWCEVAHAEIRTCNLPIANPALYHTATSAPSVFICVCVCVWVYVGVQVVDRGERVSVADRQQQGRSRSQVSSA